MKQLLTPLVCSVPTTVVTCRVMMLFTQIPILDRTAIKARRTVVPMKLPKSSQHLMHSTPCLPMKFQSFHIPGTSSLLQTIHTVRCSHSSHHFLLNTLKKPVTNFPVCSYEFELPPAYEERQCNEYLKLGLMGTTFVFSSGDYGVEIDGGGCLNPNGTETNGDSGIFVPTFPGGCPYILSAVCIDSYQLNQYRLLISRTGRNTDQKRHIRCRFCYPLWGAGRGCHGVISNTGGTRR